MFLVLYLVVIYSNIRNFDGLLFLPQFRFILANSSIFVLLYGIGDQILLSEACPSLLASIGIKFFGWKKY